MQSGAGALGEGCSWCSSFYARGDLSNTSFQPALGKGKNKFYFQVFTITPTLAVVPYHYKISDTRNSSQANTAL